MTITNATQCLFAKRTCLVAAIFTISAMAWEPVRANLVGNGSFETPVLIMNSTNPPENLANPLICRADSGSSHTISSWVVFSNAVALMDNSARATNGFIFGSAEDGKQFLSGVNPPTGFSSSGSGIMQEIYELRIGALI